MDSFSESYKAAGVDVTAGYKAVELMKTHIKKTNTDGVFSSVGGFGGMFLPNISNMKEPVLVSGTDGVGTKLKIAFLTNKHSSVGIDCVAMCVNDVICAGAAPLFFLDYIACGKNTPEKIAEIVSGITEGCVQANCALIGGETAEMPGFYPIDEYDLAGFTVGMVDKDNILKPESVSAGDIVIGLSSSGVHSNGFSLVRKIFDINENSVNKYYDELSSTLGETLLTPTKIYVKPILEVLKKINVKSISHITGGGFYENLPRAIPEKTGVKINKNSFEILPIFKLMQKIGNIPERDMFNTFNMGIGMALIVDKTDAENCVDILNSLGEKAQIIGEITNNGGVEIC